MFAQKMIAVLTIRPNVLYMLTRYYDTYLPFLLEACNDENPDVRQVCTKYIILDFSPQVLASSDRFFFQAAVYGLGVCAEFGGSVIKPLVGGTILFPYIMELISFYNLFEFIVFY